MQLQSPLIQPGASAKQNDAQTNDYSTNASHELKIKMSTAVSKRQRKPRHLYQSQIMAQGTTIHPTNVSPSAFRQSAAFRNLVYSPAMKKFKMSSDLRISMKSAGTITEQVILGESRNGSSRA